MGTKGRFLGDTRSQIKALLILAISLFLFWGVSIQFFAERGVPCAACHATKKQYASWKTSPHKNISCLACHKDTGYLSFARLELGSGKNFVAWLFRAYQDPVASQVGNEGCLVCHDREVKHTIVSKGIRVSHKEFENYHCTDCHANVAHEIEGRTRNQPDMDSCSDCHNYYEGDVECEKCHPSNAETEKLSTRGPWKITHGPAWKSTHGMGDPKTCATCHDALFCMSCHNSEVPHPQPWSHLHPRSAKQNVQGCYQCHRKELCMDCHRIEMPHPDGFLRNHEFEVEERGYDLCWRCHSGNNCMPCHLSAAHTNTPDRKFKF
ncbi:MAG TPA: hypothetical protein DE036_01085 [Actinobacteria bacterium]|nr:hypothetical protein [Actinomycetota bacterium]